MPAEYLLGKMRLIEEVIEVKNERVLIELESVLKKAAEAKDRPRLSAHDFVGLWSREDAESNEKSIEEGCEQIRCKNWNYASANDLRYYAASDPLSDLTTLRSSFCKKPFKLRSSSSNGQWTPVPPLISLYSSN